MTDLSVADVLGACRFAVDCGSAYLGLDPGRLGRAVTAACYAWAGLSATRAAWRAGAWGCRRAAAGARRAAGLLRKAPPEKPSDLLVGLLDALEDDNALWGESVEAAKDGTPLKKWELYAGRLCVWVNYDPAAGEVRGVIKAAADREQDIVLSDLTAGEAEAFKAAVEKAVRRVQARDRAARRAGALAAVSRPPAANLLGSAAAPAPAGNVGWLPGRNRKAPA